MALILNGMALLFALGGAALLGMLGWVFLQTPDGADRLIGWLMLLLGCPLILAGPAVGLWLALARPELSTISLWIGGVCVGLSLLSVFVLPGMIEAAVRP